MSVLWSWSRWRIGLNLLFTLVGRWLLKVLSTRMLRGDTFRRMSLMLRGRKLSLTRKMMNVWCFGIFSRLGFIYHASIWSIASWISLGKDSSTYHKCFGYNVKNFLGCFDLRRQAPCGLLHPILWASSPTLDYVDLWVTQGSSIWLLLVSVAPEECGTWHWKDRFFALARRRSGMVTGCPTGFM